MIRSFSAELHDPRIRFSAQWHYTRVRFSKESHHGRTRFLQDCRNKFAAQQLWHALKKCLTQSLFIYVRGPQRAYVC